MFENSIPTEWNRTKHKTPSTHCGPIFLRFRNAVCLSDICRSFSTTLFILLFTSSLIRPVKCLKYLGSFEEGIVPAREQTIGKWSEISAKHIPIWWISQGVRIDMINKGRGVVSYSGIFGYQRISMYWDVAAFIFLKPSRNFGSTVRAIVPIKKQPIRNPVIWPV